MNTKQSLTMEFKLVDQHDDIIIAEFPNQLKLDLDTAINIVSHRISFTNNKKHYIVADVSNIISMTTDAKRYLQKPEFGLKNIMGAALIASNPLAALIANIFIKTRCDFESRFFSKKDDAINWILNQKESNLKLIQEVK